MKLYYKKIINSEIAIRIRNTLNISPVDMTTKGIHSGSVSDSFLWRTDNNFSTKIKFLDILNFYYDENETTANIIFYDSNFNFLKKINFSKLNKINELIIDKKFFNNKEGYGTFYIFHDTKNKLEQKKIISNRCYIGFSKNNQHFSYTHGNLLARYKTLDGNKSIKSDIIKTSLIMNQNYKIKKYFNKNLINEIFLANPTSKKVNFKIGKNLYSLREGCSIIINLKDQNVVNIKSNCLFLRPLVFSYNKEFFDVHHG